MNLNQYEDFKRKVLNTYEYPERNIILELMQLYEETEDLKEHDEYLQLEKLRKEISTL